MPKLLLLLLLFLVAGLASSGVTAAFGWGSAPAVPSESECRPYIEKALKELSADTTAQEAVHTTSGPETPQTTDTSKEDSKEEGSIEGKDDSTTIESQEKDEGDKSGEEVGKESGESGESGKSTEGGDTSVEDTSAGEEKSAEDKAAEEISADAQDDKSGETEETKSEEKEEAKSGETEEAKSEETDEAKSGKEGTSAEPEGKSEEAENKSVETEEKSGEDKSEEKSVEEAEGTSVEADVGKEEESKEESSEQEAPVKRSAEDTGEESAEKESSDENQEAGATSKEDVTDEQADEKSSEAEEKSPQTKEESAEGEITSKEESKEDTDAGSDETAGTDHSEEQASAEATASEEKSAEGEDKSAESVEVHDEASKESEEAATESSETAAKEESGETGEEEKSEEKDKGGKSGESEEAASKEEVKIESEEANETEDKSTESGEQVSEEEKKDEESKEEAETAEGEASEEAAAPEEELTMEIYIPEKLRSRDHIAQILKLDEESAETEKLLTKTSDITLRDLKRLYDSAIKPLEVLYKYRDLSNRHFGDPEIFSKPLVLFMGPWSGGKSTIINYLLDNEYKKSALRTGAEPSPAYFNILMYGEQEEVLDGTQLAADWTFSGLQKFGQGLLDRLRGLKLNHPLLDKVNIIEIPGILEIRKQVERLFPFNDACQWFIDRADVIFLVYDPSKLDVGPETEAILDQLKGRESQTRIILNKADQVKPEELMRVQGTLIWNISPLMSSSEPPIMYSASLWSLPYETGAPTRLLQAQERAFLQDLRSAIDKRVENKIASARRFAVRVRNHAKMVDCYLTTYYNHKSFFGNRKKVADDITDHPQNYHIYEGLSTLTNISRYDLPDPEVYRDFFRLNPLYDFQQLSATCTYFRGCPINRLDVAIAYELPELVGKYKKNAEAVVASDAGTGTPPKS